MSTTPVHAAPTEALAKRLEDPAVAGALATILDHADLLAVLIEGLDQLVERSEVIGESMLESFADLCTTVDSNEQVKAAEVDISALISSGAQLAGVLPKATPGMVQAVESGVIDRVLESDLLKPEAIDEVVLLANGLVRGGEKFATDPVPVSGPMSLVKVLKDEDVRLALSFFATVAKAIGTELRNSSTTQK